MAETPVPISFTANTNTNPTSPRSSFFRNRFSNASLLSLSSLRTLLPQYSIVNTFEEPPTPLSDVTTENRESTSTIEPPRYSLLHPRILTWRASTATRFEVEGDLPPHEFRYSYPNRAKNPWATLHLHTRVVVPGTLSKSLQNQPRVPGFWGCDPLTGTVQLNLDSPQNIQQISITLNGAIVLSSHTGGSLPFLSREFTVWNTAMGDAPQSDPRLLPGQHIFPFSFPFPTQPDPITKSSALDVNSISPFHPHTTLSSVASSSSPSYDNGRKNSTRTRRFTSAFEESPSSLKGSQISGHPHTSFGSGPSHSIASPMPPTFMEKEIDLNISYDILVRIIHGRFRASSKIETNIAYFPASESLPASQRRREAYETGGLVPCPMDDPEGWLALPTVTIYGMVKIDDNSLPTKVDCTLYIAQPLSYTRGSHIPCFITIHCDGIEIAHLLPSTDRPTVRLLRRVWHPVTNHGIEEPGGHDYISITGWTYVTVMPTSNMNLVSHEVGRANWWTPSKDIDRSPNSRHWEGEIHLSPDLQPSCGFQSFRIEYAVELLSLQTASFTAGDYLPSPRGNNVIASNPVEIATHYRQEEPVPVAYSEPPRRYRKQRVALDKGATF